MKEKIDQNVIKSAIEIRDADRANPATDYDTEGPVVDALRTACLRPLQILRDKAEYTKAVRSRERKGIDQQG